jgi:hypothetical protein
MLMCIKQMSQWISEGFIICTWKKRQTPRRC